jgi:hypothetical protein
MPDPPPVTLPGMAVPAADEEDDVSVDARAALDIRAMLSSAVAGPVVRGLEVPVDAELAVLLAAMPPLPDDGNGAWSLRKCSGAGWNSTCMRMCRLQLVRWCNVGLSCQPPARSCLEVNTHVVEEKRLLFSSLPRFCFRCTACAGWSRS